MQLRKVLTVGSAILAASLLGLTSTATASSPTGGTLAYVAANGSTTPGAVAINGIFNSGTATFAGGTYGCTGGTVAGTVQRGAVGATPNLIFTTLSLTCTTIFGINGVIAITSGCTVDATFGGSSVHDGTVDTGTGAKFSRVFGAATIPAGCVTITIPGGCSARVSGNLPAVSFDEAITTSGGVNYQGLILNGTGLAFFGGTPQCFGLLSGTFTLNNIRFDVKITAGTTSGIDFRLNP